MADTAYVYGSDHADYGAAVKENCPVTCDSCPQAVPSTSSIMDLGSSNGQDFNRGSRDMLHRQQALLKLASLVEASASPMNEDITVLLDVQQLSES